MSDNEIEFIGDIKLHMVPSGYNKTLLAATADAKAKFPEAVKAEIKDTIPHQSTRDMVDDNNVISIEYFNKDGTLLFTIDVHDDSTYKGFWPLKYPRGGPCN
ncbi:hypothetical protein GGS24DRAFT_504101 [Hypoxylon argillaceum]|nr:hypothetical protein GGS24DRAFT_504101 [Hypoxylon argillaceum]KAI1145629.1 hypothetical protein F4825DRAFT_457299 [Nemania diffusa]